MCVSWCMHQHIHIHSWISVSTIMFCACVHLCVDSQAHICTCMHQYMHWHSCNNLGPMWFRNQMNLITYTNYSTIILWCQYIYIYAALPQSYVGHVYRWLGMASHIRKLWLVPHVLHNSTQPRCMAGSGLRLRLPMKRICRFEIVININWFQCKFLAKSKVWTQNIL